MSDNSEIYCRSCIEIKQHCICDEETPLFSYEQLLIWNEKSLNESIILVYNYFKKVIMEAFIQNKIKITSKIKKIKLYLKL